MAASAADLNLKNVKPLVLLSFETRDSTSGNIGDDHADIDVVVVDEPGATARQQEL